MSSKTKKTVKTNNKTEVNNTPPVTLLKNEDVLPSAPEKGKRGRKVGSVSFVAISLRDLNKYLKEDSSVMVSKKFADALMIQNSPIVMQPAPESELKPQITEFTEDNPAGIPQESVA